MDSETGIRLAPGYIYQPLNPHCEEIRLLTFLPRQDDSLLITCSLTVASLREKPRYTAVSYVWGSPKDSSTILVNGKFFQITENLMSALRYIQAHLASGTLSEDLPRTFWIDAICVNQEDNNEKGHQVRMMRNVFAAAVNVISWLGYDNASITSAFDFMRKVNKARDSSNKNSAKGIQLLHNGSVTQSNVTTESALIDTVVDPRLLFLLSLSESVIDFFSLPYWHRIWIVQEVTLTDPEMNVIIFGDELITFRDVQIFRDGWLGFLRGLERNREWQSVLHKTPDWESQSYSWMRYLSQMEESLVVWSYYDFMRGISGDSLFYIVLANVYQATDPRDAVYALLGMISSTKLVPDYDKSTADVYTKWFTTVLEDWQNLQPLYFSGHTESRFKQLPSWVPDLSTRRNNSPVWDATFASTIEEAAQPTRFQFSQHIEQPFPSISDNNILRARGIWYSDVSTVQQVHHQHANRKLLEFCTLHLSDERSRTYRTGIPLLQAVFRVLMCGINRFGAFESETALATTSKELQVAVGLERLQLTGSMPFLQAVTKTLLLRDSLSPESTDEFVLKSLCKASVPLDTDMSSDLCLAAAFLSYMISGRREKSAQAVLQTLNLSPGSHFFQAFLECFFSNKLDKVKDLVSNNILQDTKVEQLVDSIHRYFQIYQHTLFFTSSGYLGNGPPTMRLGDRIVVFDDAKMPFVVRNMGMTWSLVGPCYIEGISNGEPAAMARRGEVVIVNIPLS